MTSSARRMVSSSFLAGVANWPAFSAADGQEEKGSAERTSQASSREWGGGMQSKPWPSTCTLHFSQIGPPSLTVSYHMQEGPRDGTDA